ncbi:MAG: pyridoxine 5'-phosphate synthase, partial [Phycisphaerae bacterium]
SPQDRAHSVLRTVPVPYNAPGLTGRSVIMARLGVNIDHVATVRQARRADEPDPVWAAAEAELGGADGITFHLREDRRHIGDRDARVLRETVGVKLNMEMSIAPEIVDLACRIKPDQATLVPERREELTTEGGLDVVKHARSIEQVVERLGGAGVTVASFIEPIADQIKASADCGCTSVELWTGGYAHARTTDERRRSLDELSAGIEAGQRAGVIVDGGHGLTYRNVGPIAALAGFREFNIGHSIIARAVFVGVRQAVAQMKALLERHASA